MDDRSQSFLSRIFECVNLGLECSAKQVRSRVPCPSKKKKTKSHTENEGSRDSDGTEKDTGSITVNKVEENMADGEGLHKSSSPCPKPENQLLNEDICAEIGNEPTCCFIKMQDPCALCCCETPVPVKACPPKNYRQEPREPTCECDLCKKSVVGGKCCREKNKHGTGRNSEEREPGRLRKA